MTKQAPTPDHRMSSRVGHWSLLICWSLVIGHSGILRADSVFVDNIERKGVVIRELKGEMLLFEINDRPIEAPMSRITRIVVASEPPLTQGEESFASGKWDEAADAYQKALRTTSKQWVKDWSSRRLMEAASKTGRFDAAVAAYIVALLGDPSGAARLRPAMPQPPSTYLDTAVGQVNAALGDTKLTAEQRRALLGFLVELHQVRGDSAAEDTAYAQLTRLPGADSDDPGARRILARRRITVATKAMEAGNYLQAVNEIHSGRALFVETTQQAEALFIIAEASYGLAAASGQPDALKDAALAYMRVVALAKDEPRRPRVVESLLKTAAIMERLGEPQTGARLCEQIVAQFPDDPQTPRARQALEKLKEPVAAEP